MVHQVKGCEEKKKRHRLATYRAIGTGPAGPAAAAPVFTQSTREKMPVGARGKHALLPEESPRRNVSFGKVL